MKHQTTTVSDASISKLLISGEKRNRSAPFRKQNKGQIKEHKDHNHQQYPLKQFSVLVEELEPQP